METLRSSVLVSAGLAFLALCSGLLAREGDATINDNDINVVHYEQLEYPVWAAGEGREGVVVIKLQLDDTGKVVGAIALSGASTLVPDTLKNAQRWLFRPNPERSAVIVYEFRIGLGCRRNSPYSEMTFHAPNLAVVVNCRTPVDVP